MIIKLPLLGIAASAGLIAAAVTAQESQSDLPHEAIEDGIRSTPMGPLCWAAIVETAYQTSSRCDLGEDAANQATIDAFSNARDALGGNFLANGWTAEGLAAFRAQQGQADASAEQLCGFDRETDTGRFILALAKTPPESIREVTDEMLEHEGEPVWGTCL